MTNKWRIFKESQIEICVEELDRISKFYESSTILDNSTIFRLENEKSRSIPLISQRRDKYSQVLNRIVFSLKGTVQRTLYYGRSNELAKSEIPKGIPCTPRDRPVPFSNPRVANWPGRCFLLHATKYYQQFPSNQRGSRTWRRRVALERATSPLVHRGNHEAGMERRMNGGWGRRGTRGKRNNERDAYVSFLIVTGSTLRYRPREARPCHYYPIISCITVTVNEVSYYAARRGGGWKKRGERRPYVSWGKGGRGLAVGRCALGERRRKKEKRHSSFAIHAVYNRCELGQTLIGIERKLDDPREFIIYILDISRSMISPKFRSKEKIICSGSWFHRCQNVRRWRLISFSGDWTLLFCPTMSQKWHVYIENDE